MFARMVEGSRFCPTQKEAANGWKRGFLCDSGRCHRSRCLEAQITEKTVTFLSLLQA